MDKLYHLYQECRKRGGSVCTDTRKLQKDDLFFALKGPSFDGNQYAAKALSAGAVAAVVDDPETATDDRFVLVDDVLTTLQELATAHRRRLGIPILAITGSNGKTTTKELVYAVMSADRNTGATHGNFNNHIGVPLTLLGFDYDLDFGIVEMGANHQKEIGALCRIAEPDFGLITNIGLAHLEGFGGPEGIKKGKGELFDYLKANGGTIFCWWDSSDLRDLAADYGRVIRYGAEGFVSGQAHPDEDSEFAALELQFGGSPPYHLRTQLVGDYNIPNVLAAAAVGLHFAVPAELIYAAIEGYSPDNNRSEWKRIGANDFVLDAYNANPSSVRVALENFAKLKRTRKIVVLGDMLELGEYSAQEHRALAQQAMQTGSELVLLVGPEYAATGVEGANLFLKAEEAGDFLADKEPVNYTILVKGSRGIALEKVVEKLTGK